MSDNSNSQISRLLEITESFNCFLSKTGEPYLIITYYDHEEVWPLESDYTYQYLMSVYLSLFDQLPQEKSIESVIRQMIFNTKRSNKVHNVYYRIANNNDSIIIDVGDEKWRAIEVNQNGWRILEKSPVYFYRTNNTQAFSLPKMNSEQNQESIYLLRKYLNLESNDDFVLILAYCFGVLTCSQAYPILILQGGQGTAKSTTSSILKSLLDPGKPTLRSTPANEEGLFIAAKQAHLLCLDNLSGLPPWASDALCKISTTGSFSKRKLYSNDDEVVIEVAKPILVNGIDDLTTRPDLGDRSIVLHLPKIKDSERKSATLFWKEFEIDKPKIFCALLNAISYGLSIQNSIVLNEKPRMSDFVQFACACLKYFNISPEQSIRIFFENRNQMSKDIIDLNSIGRRIMCFMRDKNFWKGTPSELFMELSKLDFVSGDFSYTKSPQTLSRELNRISPALKAYQIDVDTKRESNGRKILLKKTQNIATVPSIATRSQLNEEPEGNL